jgi:hypothetical protein
VVDLENEERDEFGKQPRWRARVRTAVQKFATEVAG